MKKILKLYCPYDPDISIERSLQFLESQFPLYQLNKTITTKGKLMPVSDRVSFLKESILSQKKIPLITNGEEVAMINFSGYLWNYQYRFSNTQLWYIIIEIGATVQPVSSYAYLVKELGFILKPYWATLNRQDTERITALQLQPTSFAQATELGLPRLNSSSNYVGPEIPSNLGWINYWSKDTCQSCLSNDNDHKKYIYFEEELSDGARLIQITREPLDFNNDKDLETMKKMYHEIPKVGGRD